MRKFILLSFLLFFTTFFLHAQNNKNTAFTDTQWNLTNLNEKVINANDEGVKSFIVFLPDNTFKGFSGCNRFQGTYKITKNKIKLSSIGLTKMFCEKDNNERELIKALEKATSFKVNNNQLVLKGKRHINILFEAEN
ncbi:MAG: META domain-containing protein [Bacteroidia bacterium]|nr:META domain-containing protein [Bacteroidia bacterium]MCZ2247280.1 META domain-containing protein [Bacteroidia bacterium]